MSFRYTRHSDDEGSLTYFCDHCGMMARCHLGEGHPTPNCALLFGNEAHIDENLKLKQTA